MCYSPKGHKELDMTEHTHRISQENGGNGKKAISGRVRISSVFFSSCDSVVGDFLEFNQANRGSLCF